MIKTLRMDTLGMHFLSCLAWVVDGFLRPYTDSRAFTFSSKFKPKIFSLQQTLS